MKLQIGMDSMLKLLREFITQTGFAVCTHILYSSKHLPTGGVLTIKWNNDCIKILVSISSLRVQMRRWKGRTGTWTVPRGIAGTKLFGSMRPLKTDAPYFDP